MSSKSSITSVVPFTESIETDAASASLPVALAESERAEEGNGNRVRRSGECLMAVESVREYRALVNREMMDRLRQFWGTATHPIHVA